MRSYLLLAFAITSSIAIFIANGTDANIASWHMINVNQGKLQGDANLIIIGKTIVMIDAGYSSEAKANVLPYLKKQNIKVIDHFFISHPHRDHYEGLAPILDSGIYIRNLYYKIPAPEISDCCYDKKDFLKFIQYAKDHGANLIVPVTGDKIKIEDTAVFDILHAQEGNLPGIKLDVNDLSLIMKLTLKNGVTVLFPGDINLSLGTYLSNDPRLKADYLKMPHHGISGIAPNSFFDTVNPDTVLVPGPKHLWCSKRGHQARTWTETNKLPTWVNGLHGNIKVEWKAGSTLITPDIADNSCDS